MKKRLLEFLEYLGMGQNAFEKSVGMSTGSISGMTHGMRSDNLTKILIKYPELDIYWLLLGKGNMIKEKDQFTDPAQIEELNKTISLLRDIVADMRAEIAELKKNSCKQSTNN